MSDDSYPILEDVEEELGFRIAAKLGRVLEGYTDGPEKDYELYGTSPRVIGLFMILVTVFFPVGIINEGYFTVFRPEFVYSGFWMIQGLNLGSLWFLFRPFELITTFWISIPLCSLNFLYIRQINRFFQGETSRDISLMYGILSVILPSAITLALWSSINFPLVITPIPIQFLVGIMLLYKFKEPEVISPWEGFYLDWSWWTRQKHSLEDPGAEVINLTKLLKEHDADWLEGYDE